MSNKRYTIGQAVDLCREQDATLSSPRLKSNFLLKIFYVTFNLIYGAKPTLPKFKVLEMLARYPYWAWETGGYFRLSRLFSRTGKTGEDRVRLTIDIIALGRESQDNEQWHMLLLDDIIRQKKIKVGFIRHALLPRLMAFFYYHFTRTVYCLSPAASFRMNAAFESHAEHEYMKMAEENPQWDDEPVDSVYFKDYPEQRTLNDLIRRIALDERDHMHHSLEAVERLRHLRDHRRL